ncbi:helix-turn-helix domain-containing protein [Sphingomonas sp. RT2P30]|uniref:helix-turn-helix transcriptional regulator n=1 Tax=Parasphingomonas halimpatiens TaxID=3096162 RepID=UPI002FC7EDA0
MRRIRNRWMLSQEELADLLNINQARVSRYEKGEEYPSLAVALGLQVIFGRSPKSCFAAVYTFVEDGVITRAAALHRTLSGRRDPASAKKRHLLDAMMDRATRGDTP